MEIVYRKEDLLRYMNDAVKVSEDSPVLLDRFLSAAIEVDIDAVSDGEQVVIGAIMQHIEQAGVHSGDSACSLPPYSLPSDVQEAMREVVRKMAYRVRCMWAHECTTCVARRRDFCHRGESTCFENRAICLQGCGCFSRKGGSSLHGGTESRQSGCHARDRPPYYSVKEAVLPFNKFPGTDPILGPEMKSTGEVMGTGRHVCSGFCSRAVGGRRRPSDLRFVSYQRARCR